MKISGISSSRFYFLSLSLLFFNLTCFSQNPDIANQYPDTENKGMSLIKQGKYEEANKFFTDELKKDQSDRAAYFNRGNASWHLNDASNACRDWSAVLALGDTETFKLLDQNCHGAMIIEDDTIPSIQYHRMWANEKKDDKTLSANAKATIIVDEMPSFPGGTEALMDYLQKNLRYPQVAREENVTGRVYVNFIVNSKGKILFPYVTHGIRYGCDEEAIRLIRKMPLWKPGKQNGKSVPVRYNLPVTFTLK